jgi:ElaB/YqjD/DUF883 family membrane-anchored ribosome-binding protein
MEKDIADFLSNVYILQSLCQKLGTDRDSPQLRQAEEEVRGKVFEQERSISMQLAALQKGGTPMNLLLSNKLIYQFIIARETLKSDVKHMAQTDAPAVNLEDSLSTRDERNQDPRYQRQQQFESKDQVLKMIAAERSKEIQKLKKDMEEVNKLACATSRLVSEQGSHLKAAQQNVELTAEETESAVQELAKAAREQSNQWKMTTIAMGIAVGGTFGLFLGPLGMFVGGASGGTVGAYVGDKIEEFQRDGIDNGLLEHHLKGNLKWVPDEEAVHCRQCKRMFNSFLRKHHCRKCGMVFCYLCSGQKVPIKYPNMEREQMQRVCDGCFQQFWAP